jgi:hypothetical protein
MTHLERDPKDECKRQSRTQIPNVLSRRPNAIQKNLCRRNANVPCGAYWRRLVHDFWLSHLSAVVSLRLVVCLRCLWRSKFSHCILFNPTDPKSARYNPLLEVRKGPDEVRDVQNIADILVDPEGALERRNDWKKTSHSLLVSVILLPRHCGGIDPKSAVKSTILTR